ncbi:NACHT domain-containing protein [Streptomyces sp. NBC_00038]|uniref:NACHT domain-containing protein n=1 Tax=Streptomyces sp. NBC_00038 TaxID=2903615 RepID=UPI002255788D|nr:NACHT domain-containing protein [Streptomyces sp. NBC_00038]MCX5557355.1 NACHT domain-containing protein [Streptomyces sp. NBC_00038]
MSDSQERVKISVLESDNNKKGDLFGRAIQDLFHALGYEDFSLNVHKAGREIDITGKHRTEQRTLIAECKATKGATGGSDVNKFAGAVQVERSRKSELELTPYFVSLGGFTAPAYEQEEDAGKRLILMDAPKIVDELVRGRVIVSREQAVIVASTCPELPDRAILGQRCSLVIHEIGWVWAFYFKTGGRYTIYTLIHADGYGLDEDLVTSIVEADAISARNFTGLTYVAPRDVPDSSPRQDQATASYFAYLERECGGVTLEGLPADQEVGGKRIRLESIYVPLHLSAIPKTEKGEAEKSSNPSLSKTNTSRITVSETIKSHKHVAILGAPGAGKTTLLKRLAVAYAAAERRDEVGDELPKTDWFPLFIRCRQLGEQVRKPVTELIQDLPRFAELPHLREAFSRRVSDALKHGQALLLVDGLDEISDPGDRAAFAAQLRTFIGTYPAVRVIITCREAGFRAVSGAMSSVCSLFRIADLSVKDIFTLSRAWQHEVVGGTTESANKIAQSIVSQPRVLDLAINPLLLATLLLVQRWLGELPPKRSVLYDKAIEVLLMTWNTEGHTPIDQDEALPQLAYAAFSMMTSNRQSISAKGLRDLFEESRTQMPEVLGYARMSATELIERVEDRSSLLVQSGHIIEDGQLRPLYEFKHLTFQEYLAARACVESWNPLREEKDDYTQILFPYLEDESWSEVIPLATVLSGSRGAKLMIDMLIDFLDSPETRGTVDAIERGEEAETLVGETLLQCLVDEVQISPQQVRKALDCLIRNVNLNETNVVEGIIQSRFAAEIPEVIWSGYLTHNEHVMEYAAAISSLAILTVLSGEDFSQEVVSLLRSTSQKDVISGIACVMLLAYSRQQHDDRPEGENADDQQEVVPQEEMPSAEMFAEYKSLVIDVLENSGGDPSVASMSFWALAWLGEQVPWTDSELQKVLTSCISAWHDSEYEDFKRTAAWCIWRLPIALHVEEISVPQDGKLREFLSAEAIRPAKRNFTRDFARAALVISYYGNWEFPYVENTLTDHESGKSAKQWSEKLEKAVEAGSKS